jgi:shikimate kinase
VPIALIGMPGSGKSAIGKAAAKRLALSYADCDQAIERRAGCSIAEFFSANGEQAFRELESDMLTTLVDDSRSVIATGGGVVLRPANRELLRSRTCCVYLRASSELLWKRLRNDRRRPLLQVADPQARLRQMHAERAPLYEEVAHLVIDTDGLPFARIVDEVVRGVEAEVGP